MAEVDDDQQRTVYVRTNETLLLGLLRPTLNPSETVYPVHDSLGSIRALVSEEGTVTDHYEIAAFGELRRHVGSDPNPYVFAGETSLPRAGITYHRARWMHPETGRFLTADKAAPQLDRPATLNRFEYAESDPVNRVDPLGTYSLLSISASLAVINGGLTFGYSIYREVSPSRALSRSAFVAALTFLAVYYLVPVAEGVLGKLVLTAGGGAVQGLYGSVAVQALQRAASGGGPTTTVYTNLSRLPQAGRALSVATGPRARALAEAARAGSQIYRARIPNALIQLLEEAGLVVRSTTLMGGVYAEELRFAPQATQFVVQFFEIVGR